MFDRLMFWIFPALAPPKPVLQADRSVQVGLLTVAPLVQALVEYQKAQEDDSLLGQLKRSNGRCPDCGGDLLMGPAGGTCVNVMCAECRNRFNIGFDFNDPFFIQRI